MPRKLLVAAVRPSLRQNLRGVRSSLKALAGELVAQARHGRTLERLARGRKGLRLNIGSGKNAVQGWLNLDGYATGKDVLYHNFLNRLPLDDGSVCRIHCEHFLEHLDFDHAVAFLVDCRRVLAVDGSMRVIVPDAEKYLAAYAAGDEAFFGQLSPFYSR